MMKRSIFVLAALAGCVAAGPACSSGGSSGNPESSQTGDKGKFDLNLVVNGETIDVVRMTLSSSALPSSIVKDINTSKVTGSVKAFAGLLPVGDYSVSFSATTSAGKACTGSGGPFPVTAGGTAQVSVSIVCGGTAAAPARGNANITASVSAAVQCPYLTEVIIAPTELEAGGVIDLSAKLSDLTGTFSWSASPATGTFGSASSPITTFTAGAAGSYTLTAALDQAGCTTDSVSTPVVFSPVSGGGGGGGAGGSTGGTNTGGVNTGGTNTGGTNTGGVLPVTGGVPNTGGVQNTGGTGTGGVVTPSTVYCGFTQATPPISPKTDVPGNAANCGTCEQNNCDAPVAPGCDSFAAGSPEKAACLDVLACVRTSNCQETGGALNCFCGPGVDIVACKANLTNPIGVCKAAIIAGYPSGSSAAFIVDNSTRVDIPGAAALALAQCDFAFCGPPALGGGSECVPYCQ